MSREKQNLPINYQEQLAKEAAEIAKRIAAPSGDRIRLNGNVGFITPDNHEAEQLEAVIIDFVSSNMFYDSTFDAGKPMPPACFAIGPEPTMLAPSNNSPAKQSDTCAPCPNNQFGSKGRGKACKNTRLIAVTSIDALDGQDPPIWIMSIPPTSVKAFDAYVSSLAVKHRTVPTGVVTKITMDKSTTFASPRFDVVRPLESTELAAFMGRRQEANARLSAEPDVSGYEAPRRATVGRR